jgi:hypothetical protein
MEPAGKQHWQTSRGGGGACLCCTSTAPIGNVCTRPAIACYVPTAVDSESELFAEFVSLVVDATDDVAVTGLCLARTTTVISRAVKGASEPRLQVDFAPLNVHVAPPVVTTFAPLICVRSVTPSAGSGPTLVTVTV